MIKSAVIENFRGFTRAEISDLGLFNIVVGDNGAGKTAFLEALFTASASDPSGVLKLRAWRGIPVSLTSTTQQTPYEAVWGDLFNGFDLGKIISVSLEGSDGDSRAVRIFASDQPNVLPLSNEISAISELSAAVTFEWIPPTGVPSQTTPKITREGISSPSVPETNIFGSFIAARTPFNAAENAQMFSDLSTRNEEEKFVRAVKKEFNYIESMSVELEYGSPMLFIKTRGQKRKIPINLISDGMNKIAALFLHMSTPLRKVVFIDEIDTGIYFERYESFVRQLHSFAKAHDTQIFSTTHSLEFLKAALPTMKKNPRDFSLVRIYRKENTSSATIVSGEKALELIGSGLEVRI